MFRGRWCPLGVVQNDKEGMDPGGPEGRLTASFTFTEPVFLELLQEMLKCWETLGKTWDGTWRASASAVAVSMMSKAVTTQRSYMRYPVTSKELIAETSQVAVRILKWLYLASTMVWMSVSPHPPQIHMFKLAPKMIVLGGRACGRWPGPEGFALVNRINALMKEARESSPVPATVGGRGEPRRGLSAEGDRADALILDFPAFGAVRNKFRLLINYPVCGVWL